MGVNPVQGAGTDDELRELIARGYAAWVGSPFQPTHWQTENGFDLADALLSDPGVLAAMQHREQQAAAKALRDAAEEAQDHGTVDEDWAVDVETLLALAAALDPNERPDQ